MQGKWRVVWIVALLLLWLFCSGTAQAGALADRLAKFPDWHGKPIAPVAEGDLDYPDWFLGDWRVTTTLVDMVAPLAPEVITPGFESNRQFLNQPIAFQVRFVEAQPEGIESLMQLLGLEEPQIVPDRAFNGLNLAKAYLGDRAVLTVKVDPRNPNRQITLMQDDRQLVSIVTARAIESPNPDQFITTEFFQQEFLGTSEIYFNEVENTTAYMHRSSVDADTPEITADQVTAIYLSPQDPDYFEAIDPDNLFGEPRPVALYRYRMEFFKATQSEGNPYPLSLRLKGS
ncbi:MAG: hypothetical protein HC865_12930 [Cyanobacteria bacterium RU_5_0]|nr:hypothetical protein [Cyanobacteria bacterium RU_5_0]